MTRPAFALVAAVLLLAGCGEAEPRGAPSPAGSPTVLGELPPNSVGGIERIYGQGLERLGLRLVRAALVDRTEGRFDYDPQGTHLALYVEPMGASSIRDYVERIVPVTELFASTLFGNWSGLESFDVCQEPSPNVDDAREPTPVTQVTLWREEATEIDWSTFDLVQLLALSRQANASEGRPRALVATNPAVAGFPTYRDALVEAEELASADA